MGDKLEADLPNPHLFCFAQFHIIGDMGSLYVIFDIDIDINSEIDIDIVKPSEVEIKSQHKKLTWLPWLMELLLNRMDTSCIGSSQI